jgi:hypothetical protein
MFVGNTDANALSHSNLNGFLFADVGQEASGMPLSVLSTLARLGMDPWQEAGRLAKLPRNAAVDALARVIATMPASPWSLPDATDIAVRLVALLPTGTSGQAPAPAPAPSGTLATRVMAMLFPSAGQAPRAARPWPRMNRRLLIVLILLGAVLVGETLNLTGQLGTTADAGLASGSSLGEPNISGIPPTGHVPSSK